MQGGAILSCSKTEQTNPEPGRGGRRVTQTDIARRAGVHNTTVSLALRNNPSISEEVRRRIQELAQEMGYRPDPALQALIAYRTDQLTERRTETLAFVTNGETQWGWRRMPAQEQYFLGAKRRAEAAGYQLEHFWLGAPSMSSRRLGDMLFHRGIRGVLLGYDTTQWTAVPAFDWNRFSAVGVGWRSPSLRIHRVTNDPEEALALALRQCLQAGRRRPGLLLPAQWDPGARLSLAAAFRREQALLGACGSIPVFMSLGNALSPAFCPARTLLQNTGALRRWLTTHSPDVILGSRVDALEKLGACGLRVPEDMAFVDLFREEGQGGPAGVRQGCERAGEIAVELLTGQLQRNQQGLPEVPTVTLVENLWCEGESLPRIQAEAWSGMETALPRSRLRARVTSAA